MIFKGLIFNFQTAFFNKNIKFIITLFLAGVVNPIYSQLSDSLTIYYKFTNEAELDIIDNKIATAIEKYEKAFLYKKDPFIRDCYNLGVCYAILKQKQQSFNMLSHVISYGYPLDSVFKKKSLSFLSKNKWRKKMIKAQEHQQFDKKYKSKVDSLLYVDQMFRKINRNKLKETIKVVDSLNVISMLNILNTEGLPSEKKIGFDYQPLNAIFMHNANYSLEINNRFDFSEYLYKGIYNGELDSRIVAHNIEGMSSISYGFFGSGLVRYALCLSEATDGYCKKMEYSKKGLVN